MAASRAAFALGLLLLLVGSIVGLLLARAIVGFILLGIPGWVGALLITAYTFDLLWCGLMAVVGYGLLRGSPGVRTFLAVSTLMWMGGTIMYLLLAAKGSEGPTFASLGMDPWLLVLGVLAMRLVFWSPNLAAHLLLRRRRHEQKPADESPRSSGDRQDHGPIVGTK